MGILGNVSDSSVALTGYLSILALEVSTTVNVSGFSLTPVKDRTGIVSDSTCWSVYQSNITYVL